MKKLIAPFVLDVLVATAGTYVAVSQLLEGFSWLAVAILATLAGANIFAAFKLGTNGRLKFSSTAVATRTSKTNGAISFFMLALL